MSLIKSALQGKWLGHPLHPALVHVPTGLFPAALLFDLIVLAGNNPDVFERCASWSIAVGLIGAIVAAPTGLADWLEIKPGKPARPLGLVHMLMNVVVLALMTISLYLRWTDYPPRTPTPTTGAVATNLIGNLLLFISGYVGGRMVFDRGVGVARFSKQKWERIARAGRARLPVE